MNYVEGCMNMPHSQEYKISVDKIYLLIKTLRRYKTILTDKDIKHNISQKMNVLNEVIRDCDKTIRKYQNKIRRSEKNGNRTD